jgi:acid phosphatase type 7
VKGMAARETDIAMIHHVGDLSYADGTAHVWDGWMDMIQPISTSVPIMVAVGNHEYDHMSGGGSAKDPSHFVTTESGFMPVWGNFANDSGGVPTSKRFAMPAGDVDTNPNNGVFWYWFDYGLLRTIVLSSEHDMSEGSVQHEWFETVLRTTDRTVTPWVIVELHRPLYEGEEINSNYYMGVAMRYEIEDLLYDYQVDVVFAGHYHAYYRTYV